MDALSDALPRGVVKYQAAGSIMIYMDHHATTPLEPAVLDAMMPYLTTEFANAASSHEPGRRAAQAVQQARCQVAELIGADPEEVIFTSGATESNNLALKGVAWSLHHQGRHIITGATEHPAVLDTAKALEEQGFQVTYLPVDEYGRISPDALAQAITQQTILVSLMYANNEIGTLHPIAEISRITRERGILLHCDAVQAVGKIPCRVDDLGVDLLSISGHKIYGPKGIGALYLRRQRKPRAHLVPLLHGGGHENGLRSGTLNVPGIVGLGAACAIAGRGMAEESRRLLTLRERLWEGLNQELDHLYLNGHPTERLPGNLNVSFEYIDSESLLLSLKDIALSSGSACTSKSPVSSHVLRAIGRPESLARGAVRFGLGRCNTVSDVEEVLRQVVRQVRRLRSLSPTYHATR